MVGRIFFFFFSLVKLLTSSPTQSRKTTFDQFCLASTIYITIQSVYIKLFYHEVSIGGLQMTSVNLENPSVLLRYLDIFGQLVGFGF